MKVHFFEQATFDLNFCGILPEKESVGDDNGSAPILFQAIQDQTKKQIGSLRASQGDREVVLNGGVLGAAIRRVHQNNIELAVLLVLPIANVVFERVVMEDLGAVDVVQQHIRHA